MRFLYTNAAGSLAAVFVLIGCVTTPAPSPPPVSLDGAALCRAVLAVDEARAPSGLSGHEATFAEVYGGGASVDPAWARSAGPALVDCLRGQTGRCDAAEAIQPRLALTSLGRARAGQAEALQAALSRDPGCAAARSLAAEQSTDPGAKLAHLQAVRAVDPGCAHCDRGIAESALAVGQPGVAREALRRALVTTPSDVELLTTYAPLAAAHQAAEGIAAYRALLAAEDSRLTHRALARLLEASGDKAGALVHVEAALKIEPADVELARARVRLTGEAGRADALRALVDLDKGALEALLQLAALEEKARPDVALALYDRALSQGAGEPAVARRAALLKTLLVPTGAVSGRIKTVVNAVRRKLQPLYADVVKPAPAKTGKEGRIDVVVVTDKAGAVTKMEIVKDTLGVARVRAALMGHMARARIRGGAREHSFSLEFKK